MLLLQEAAPPPHSRNNGATKQSRLQEVNISWPFFSDDLVFFLRGIVWPILAPQKKGDDSIWISTVSVSCSVSFSGASKILKGSSQVNNLQCKRHLLLEPAQPCNGRSCKIFDETSFMRGLKSAKVYYVSTRTKFLGMFEWFWMSPVDCWLRMKTRVRHCKTGSGGNGWQDMTRLSYPATHISQTNLHVAGWPASIHSQHEQPLIWVLESLLL